MIENSNQTAGLYDSLLKEIAEHKKTEEKLSELLSLHKAILEATANGILVINTEGKVVSYNRKFLQLWRIPEILAEEGDDDKLLAYVLDQLSEPEEFISEVKRLYTHPEESSSDTLKFKDGRVFERISQPQKTGEKIIGRVWNFRDISERKKTEKALWESQEQYRALVDNTALGITIIDTNYNIIMTNSTICKLFKKSAKELEGKKCFREYEKRTEACPHCPGRRAMASKTTAEVETQAVLDDGTRIYVKNRAIPFFGQEGQVKGFIEIVENIDERKRIERDLQKNEERFRIAAKIASDLIWELDIKSGHLKWLGDIDEKLGYEKGKFHRTLEAWENTVHPDDYPRVMNALNEHLKEGTPYETEYRVRKKDGTFLVWTDCGATLLDEEGNPEKIIGVCSDITDKKKAETQQQELLKQLEKANEELTNFAYVVSHDLKAPLRGIKVLADWICSDYTDKLDEEGKEQLDLLANRVDRMHNLITGILQYSRIGRLKEEIIRVDLNKHVPEIIDMLAPVENIAITIENKLPTVKCEQTRICQVFQNLLSNAVKYIDKPEGRIKVGCVEENGFWKFSIADNGPGIEEKHYQKIFQLFQTLSARDDFESTGVGLTLVKKIVELYGGKIWVESELGQGSTFFFTMPINSERVRNEQLQTNFAD
jgi:PAS domain S-box-containing protein